MIKIAAMGGAVPRMCTSQKINGCWHIIISTIILITLFFVCH